jgi:hypothetical protein
MDMDKLLRFRLLNQGLIAAKHASISESVSWLGAVQSQEFTDAKWSVGQRVGTVNEDDFDRAFNDGTILRTHVLRPTWHFVAAADIRWMLALTATRVKMCMRTNDRKLGLDEAVFSRSNNIIEQALANRESLTRLELAEVLRQNEFQLKENSLVHLLMRAELETIICSGPLREGKQTYALLAARVPQSKQFTQEEALAELTFRYFRSHGPATAQDFSWWSGLTLTDARTGLELNKARLSSERIDDVTYWFEPRASLVNPPAELHLLPNFDEYVVSYTNRQALLRSAGQLLAQGELLSHRTLIMDGQVAGTWKPDKTKAGTTITINTFSKLSNNELILLTQAVQRYGTFYGKSVDYRIVD